MVHIKIKKSKSALFILFCVLSSIILPGCEKKELELFDGWGGKTRVGNACEGKKDIMFEGRPGTLFILDKSTGIVDYLCQDYSCAHKDDDYNCISNRSTFTMQFFSGHYYFADGGNGGYVELLGDKYYEVEHTDFGESPFIYDNKIYYLREIRNEDENKDRDDLICQNIDGTNKKIISTNEHIEKFVPMKGGYLYNTLECALYYVDADGNNKKRITDEKVDDFFYDEDDEYIYYTVFDEIKSGLFRVKIDSTGEEEINSNGGYIAAITEDKIYYNVHEQDKKGLYILNKDGTGLNIISEYEMNVNVMKKWGKLLCQYIDNPDYPNNDGWVCMDLDGSNKEKIILPNEKMKIDEYKEEVLLEIESIKKNNNE